MITTINNTRYVKYGLTYLMLVPSGLQRELLGDQPVTDPGTLGTIVWDPLQIGVIRANNITKLVTALKNAGFDDNSANTLSTTMDPDNAHAHLIDSILSFATNDGRTAVAGVKAFIQKYGFYSMPPHPPPPEAEVMLNQLALIVENAHLAAHKAST